MPTLDWLQRECIMMYVHGHFIMKEGIEDGYDEGRKVGSRDK